MKRHAMPCHYLGHRLWPGPSWPLCQSPSQLVGLSIRCSNTYTGAREILIFWHGCPPGQFHSERTGNNFSVNKRPYRLWDTFCFIWTQKQEQKLENIWKCLFLFMLLPQITVNVAVGAKQLLNKLNGYLFCIFRVKKITQITTHCFLVIANKMHTKSLKLLIKYNQKLLQNIRTET